MSLQNIDSNTTLEQLKSVPNFEFKKICQNYEIKIIGGINSKVKDIKAKLLLAKIQESFKENLPIDDQNGKIGNLAAESPTVLSEKGAGNGTGNVLSNVTNTKDQEEETHNLDKTAQQFFAIRINLPTSRETNSSESVAAADFDPLTTPLPPEAGDDHDGGYKTPERSKIDLQIFNKMSDALIKFKTLNDKSSTLSPKISSYTSAVNYVKNISQRDFKKENLIISTPFDNNGPKIAPEIKMNNYPKIGDKDAINIIKLINFNDVTSLKLFLEENPNRLASLQSCGPLILVPNMRWNPVHFASKNDKVEVLRLYLELLTFPESRLLSLKSRVDSGDSITSYTSSISLTSQNSASSYCTRHLNFSFSEEKNPGLLDQLLQNDKNFNETAIRLISSFFNDKDKINEDTPLHLACKYNNIEVVRFLIYEAFMKVPVSDNEEGLTGLSNLVSSPDLNEKNLACRKELINLLLTNKHGKTAMEVIGQCCPKSDLSTSKSEKIRKILSELHVLKISGATDGKIKLVRYDLKNLPKSFAGPYSDEVLEKLKDDIYFNNSCKNRLTVGAVTSCAATGERAAAGGFNLKIKNSNKSKIIKNLVTERRQILCSDFEKGLCKFTRKVCFENMVNFYEYWPFLEKSVFWDFKNFEDYNFLGLVEDIFIKKRQRVNTNSNNEIHTMVSDSITVNTINSWDSELFHSCDNSITGGLENQQSYNQSLQGQVLNFDDSLNGIEPITPAKLDDTIDDLCFDFGSINLEIEDQNKNKNGKFNVENDVNVNTQTTTPKNKRQTSLKASKFNSRKQSVGASTSTFYSASGQIEPPLKIEKLFLESDDSYTKTDKQFYDALKQFFVDENDLERQLLKYKEVYRWYNHCKSDLIMDESKVIGLRTPKR